MLVSQDEIGRRLRAVVPRLAVVDSRSLLAAFRDVHESASPFDDALLSVIRSGSFCELARMVKNRSPVSARVDLLIQNLPPIYNSETLDAIKSFLDGFSGVDCPLHLQKAGRDISWKGSVDNNSETLSRRQEQLVVSARTDGEPLLPSGETSSGEFVRPQGFLTIAGIGIVWNAANAAVRFNLLSYCRQNMGIASCGAGQFLLLLNVGAIIAFVMILRRSVYWLGVALLIMFIFLLWDLFVAISSLNEISLLSWSALVVVADLFVLLYWLRKSVYSYLLSPGSSCGDL